MPQAEIGKALPKPKPKPVQAPAVGPTIGPRQLPLPPDPNPVTKMDVATKLFAKQLKEQAAPTFLDQYGAIHRRSTTLSQQFVYDNPYTSAKLIMSSLPEEKLSGLVEAATSSFEWLRTRERFAGLPGGVLRARANALQIPDPEIRQDALGLLNRMQTLPEGEQQSLYAFLTQGALSTESLGTMLELFPGLKESVVVTGGKYQYRLQGNEPKADLRTLQILKALFPHAGLAVGLDSRSTVDRMQGTIDDAFDLASDESGLEQGLEVAEAGLTAFSAPFEAGGFALSKAFRAPANRILGGTIIANLVGGAIRGGFKALNEITMPIANAATSGIRGPERDKARGVVNGLLQLLLLHEVGKTFSSLKISREAPAELSAARLGITLKEGDIANPKIASVKETVWKYFNIPLERYFDTLGGKRFLAEVDRLRESDPSHLVGSLSRVYGEMLPFELRTIIAETPKELVPEAVTRYFREPGGERAATDLHAAAVAKGAEIKALEDLSREPVRPLDPREAPEGYSVALEGQRLNKVGEPVGDVPAESIRWIRTQDLIDKADVRLPRSESAEPGSSMEDYAAQLAGSRAFSRPVEVLVEGDRVEVVDGNHTLEAASRGGVEYVPTYAVNFPEGLSLQEAARAGYVPAAEGLTDLFPDRFRGPAATAEVDLAELARLRLERLSLEDQAASALLKRPLTIYPKKNLLRAALLEPTTRTERFLNRLFRPEIHGKVLYDAAKLVHELPNHPVLHGPGEGSPLNWRELDTDVSTMYFRRAGVPDAEARAFTDRLAKVATAQDFFTWVKDGADLIGRFLPKNTPLELRTRLTRFWDTGAEGRSDVLLPLREGERVGRPIVSNKEDGGALPSRPTDFALKVTLPDVDLVIDATSAMRRAARKLGPVGSIGYEVPRAILRFGTSVMKAPILVLRLPALITRIQAEQAVRMVQYGGAEGFWPGGVFMRRGLKTGIEAAAQEDLGGIHALHQQTHSSGPLEYAEVSTAPFRAGTRLPGREHFDAWAEGVQGTAGDWFDVQYARLGLDSAKMVDWIEQHNYAKRYMEHDQLPLLRENYDLTAAEKAGRVADDVLNTRLTREFLDRKAEAIRNQIGSDPNLLSALHTKAWRRDPPDIKGSFAAEDLILEYDGLVNKYNGIKDNVRGLPRTAQHALGALQKELFETRARMIEIEEVLGPQQVSLKRGAKLEDAGRLSAELERAWRAGEIEMPDTLVLKTRTGPAQNSIKDSLRSMGDSYQNAWYGAFKPVSWVDMKGTRGSLYYQIAAKERQGLINLGWDEKAASAHAQVTAAAKVADIMYDLSARTSLHRSLKDIFWFGPAWTEVLYTWMVKIPSRYYPGIGHAILALKAHAALDLLREMGLFQKNKDGDEVVAIPGMEGLFSGLTGEMKLKSFNLVTSNLTPGLSTIPSIALSQMALHQGGLWKEIGDFLLPYGPNLNWAPRPLVYALETLGADFEAFDKMSSALFGDQWETAKSRSFQIAYQQRIERGDLPPRAEDYTSDDMYRKAQREWMASLEGEANDYLRSQTIIQLLGSTIMPASVSVSTKARDSWLTYRNKVIDSKIGEPADKDGQFTEAQWDARRRMTDDYVLLHPEAFPYTVSYYEPADEVRYPKYRSAGDDGEFDALYSGEIKAMDSKAYVLKMLMLESMRHYSGQRDVALREISPTLDPVEILLNWNKRTAALDKTWSDMDRYFALNPEAEAYYQDHKLKLHDKYGIPINTFQADRLAETARALRIIGRQDTGLDAYDQKQIDGAARAVSALYSDSGIFGEPNTATEKAISNFWEKIYGPYRDTRNKLFDLAGKFSEAGQSDKAANIYERLRRFENDQKPVTINGVTYPTPEEVRWGMLNRQDQKDAQAKWATHPPEWLTDFQKEKVYGAKLDFEGSEQFLRKEAELRSAVDQYLEKNDISSGSSAGDFYEGWEARKAREIAQEYGPKAVEMLGLSDGTPFQRLRFAGLSNPPMNKIGAIANAISERLVKDGVSPRGFSAEASFYKDWLYTLIENKRNKQPKLDRALDDLSTTMAESGQTYKTGVPLYEALFFGNFMSDFIPDELVAIGSVREGQ